MDKRAIEMKNELKKRQPRYIALACVTLALMGVHIWRVMTAPADATWYEGFLGGFQFGLLAVLLVASVVLWVRGRRAMQSEDKLLDLYIAEHDERTQMIEQKAGKTPSMTNAVILLVAGIAAGYIDQTVFFSLISAATLVFLLTKVRIGYYRDKL